MRMFEIAERCGRSAALAGLATLLMTGATTAQIAARLGLADKTVRNHISALLTKLEVLDRTQAVIKARRAGVGRRTR